MAAWIRIRIPNADPDSRGLQRAKKEGKTHTKGRLGIKRTKSNVPVVDIKWVNVTLFSLKVNF
jgi:hypothetical protein